MGLLKMVVSWLSFVCSREGINAFFEKFQKEYDFLYQNRDCVAGYNEAVAAFDDYLNNDVCGFKKFVGEFVDFRKDFISSDREAAAFMFALESMGVLA